MAGNPRIDDLRKRIEKDPGSRLFAQLAEELRKDGELEDAIRVAREGLQKHPNYPSARMTLGRALLDTGDWTAARTEFELVLKSAADNILASRYLGECLEGLGDREGAIARYKATLAMAPAEKHVLARLQALEKGTTAGAAAPAARPAASPASPVIRPATGLRPGTVAVAPPTVAPPPAPPAAAAPPPPIPLAEVEGEMELETSGHGQVSAAPFAASSSSSAPSAPAGAPIPLVDAEEDFEIERPYESPTTSVGRSESPAPQVPPSAATAPEAESAEEHEFELEAPHEAPSTGWAPTIRPLPVVEEPPPELANWPPAAVPPPPPPPAPPPPAAGPSTLTSPTLGELYFNQGFTDKAIEVYRELIAREPGNERLTARLRELERLQRALGGGEPAAAPAPTAETPPSTDSTAAERRQAIERTIVRLEGLLSAIRKG